MGRVKVADLRSLVSRAMHNAEHTTKLSRSENPQSHAVGLRAQGRAEAFSDVLDALNGDAATLRISAGE